MCVELDFYNLINITLSCLQSSINFTFKGVKCYLQPFFSIKKILQIRNTAILAR